MAVGNVTLYKQDWADMDLARPVPQDPTQLRQNCGQHLPHYLHEHLFRILERFIQENPYEHNALEHHRSDTLRFCLMTRHTLSPDGAGIPLLQKCRRLPPLVWSLR